jgi:hypothetical protein
MAFVLKIDEFWLTSNVVVQLKDGNRDALEEVLADVVIQRLRQPVRWVPAVSMHHQAQAASEVGLADEEEVSVEASVIAGSAILEEALVSKVGTDSEDKLRQMLLLVQEVVAPAVIEGVMAGLIVILEGQLVAITNR